MSPDISRLVLMLIETLDNLKHNVFPGIHFVWVEKKSFKKPLKVEQFSSGHFVRKILTKRQLIELVKVIFLRKKKNEK